MGVLQRVLVAGTWRDAVEPAGELRAHDPATGAPIGPVYPVSGRREVEQAVAVAMAVAEEFSATEPERIAAFLDGYADGIEAEADALVALAHAETGLPVSPRLRDVELPRTSGQLHQAARAVREWSWAHPVIDTAAGLRSAFGPLGKPVVVFGPNNFPFAFNAIAGSDFASAIAARNPVIAKVHPLHPGTSQALGRIAHAALLAAGLPAAAIQLLYHADPSASALLVGHAGIGGVGFTGAPSHEGVTVVHDGFITSGDGWQVRWGPTSVPELHGGLGTRVTVVGGGEIDRDDLLRWEDERTFVVVAHCG